MIEITDENFETETKEGLTLIDFYADWCGPCRMLTPVLEEVSQEMTGVKFAKLDIDKSNKTAGDFHVTSVPTLVLTNGGKEVDRLVGLRDKEAIMAFISKEM